MRRLIIRRNGEKGIGWPQAAQCFHSVTIAVARLLNAGLGGFKVIQGQSGHQEPGGDAGAGSLAHAVSQRRVLHQLDHAHGAFFDAVHQVAGNAVFDLEAYAPIMALPFHMASATVSPKPSRNDF